MDNLYGRKDFNDESKGKGDAGMFDEVAGKCFGGGSHGEEKMRRRLDSGNFN